MGSSSAAPLDFYLTSDTFACDLALNGETSVGRVQLGGDGSAFAYVSRVQCVVAPDGDGGVILTSRGGNPTLVRPRHDDKWLQVHPAGAVHHLMPGDAVALDKKKRAGTVLTLRGPRWQWQAGDEWHDFHPLVAATLERARCRGMPRVDVDAERLVDLGAMRQLRKDDPGR